MEYSQKYCLVFFIKHIEVGAQFDMHTWPVHIAFSDVFAIERSASNIDNKLSKLMLDVAPVETLAIGESVLSTTPVVLLEKNSALASLHEKIVTVLEANGAIFNTPEFIHDGYIPHSSIQPSGQIPLNERVIITEVSLVDMFPGGDWRQRKVLANYSLKLS